MPECLSFELVSAAKLSDTTTTKFDRMFGYKINHGVASSYFICNIYVYTCVYLL